MGNTPNSVHPTTRALRGPEQSAGRTSVWTGKKLIDAPAARGRDPSVRGLIRGTPIQAGFNPKVTKQACI